MCLLVLAGKARDPLCMWVWVWRQRDQAVHHWCKMGVLKWARLVQNIIPDIKYKVLTALTGIALVSFLAAHNLTWCHFQTFAIWGFKTWGFLKSEHELHSGSSLPSLLPTPHLSQEVFCPYLESKPRPGNNKLSKNFLETKFCSKTYLQWTVNKIWPYRIYFFLVKVEKLVIIQLSLSKTA